MGQADLEELARRAATEVFESEAVAERWLAEPCVALGNVSPRSLLCDGSGLSLVLRELTAIEHGLPL